MKKEKVKEDFTVGSFTKKFIVNFILGMILTGVVIGVGIELLSSFIPTQIQPIVSFILMILGIYKICSSAIATTLCEGNFHLEDSKKINQNITIFLVVMLLIQILWNYITVFHMNAIMKMIYSMDKIWAMFLLKAIVTVIEYILIISFCRTEVNRQIFNKKRHLCLLFFYGLLIFIALWFNYFGQSLIQDILSMFLPS